MKNFKLLWLVAALSVLSFASCSDGGSDEPDPSAVITFEQASLVNHTGGLSVYYDNILWGKESASESDFGLLFDDILYTEGAAQFGSYYTDYDGMYDTWNGFAVSSNYDKTTPGYPNQFSVYASNSGKFAIGFYSTYTGGAYSIPTIEFTSPQTVLSADIANSTYTYLYCQDWTDNTFYHTLKVEGYRNGSKTGTLTVDLASNGAVAADWQHVDFSALGEVDRLVFSLETNDASQWGANTPAYFCIDNIALK